jgi:hypothetical protein
MDRPHAAEYPVSLFWIGKQRRDLDGLVLKQRRDGLRVSGAQIERALLEISVADKVVAPAQVDELRGPLLDRPLNELDPTFRKAFNVGRESDVLLELETGFVWRCGQELPPSGRKNHRLVASNSSQVAKDPLAIQGTAPPAVGGPT